MKIHGMQLLIWNHIIITVQEDAIQFDEVWGEK